MRNNCSGGKNPGGTRGDGEKKSNKMRRQKPLCHSGGKQSLTREPQGGKRSAPGIELARPLASAQTLGSRCVPSKIDCLSVWCEKSCIFLRFLRGLQWVFIPVELRDGRREAPKFAGLDGGEGPRCLEKHTTSKRLQLQATKEGPQRLSAAPNSGGGLNNLHFSPLRPLLSSPPSSLSPLSSLGPSQLAWATTAQPTWGPVLAHLKRVRNFFPTASGPAAHPRVNLTLAQEQHALTQKK